MYNILPFSLVEISKAGFTLVRIGYGFPRIQFSQQEIVTGFLWNWFTYLSPQRLLCVLHRSVVRLLVHFRSKFSPKIQAEIRPETPAVSHSVLICEPSLNED